jgi:transcription elongation factor
MSGTKKDLEKLLFLIEAGLINSWSELLERKNLIEAVRASRATGCKSGNYETERRKLYKRCAKRNSTENLLLTASMYFDLNNVFVFNHLI